MNTFIISRKQRILFSLFTFCAVYVGIAQTPTYFKGIGTTTNAIPLNAANNATHCQQIYTPADFNTLPPSGLISKVYMRNTAAGASGTYTNFSISFLQNSLTAFPNSTFLTGFTTALSVSSITINGNALAAEWFEIPLDVPFMYDNTKTLVYEIKYTNRTGGIATLNTTSVGNKRLSIVAPPGPATGNLATTWMDFGFDILSSPCAGTPLPGASVATPSTVCTNTEVQLSLTGNKVEANLTYTWQSSPTLTGPYTDISTAGGNSGLAITSTTSLYYRAAVSCNAATPEYSVPVLLTVNPAFPGNTYTINNTLPTGGTNFNNFTDAINAISCGVTGKVIFNVSPDQTFIENPPEINATGTITDSIIFRKWGAGANPVIMPAVPGTIAFSTTLGANGDAVITINGGDYITFDAIDITSNNFTSGTDIYEYGYYLKKKSPTNASKHITIKNAVITLAKGVYSFGIHVSNNSGTGTVSVSSTGGASENIKISGNTIINGYGGILVRGQSNVAFFDQNIEIGVDSGNVVTDFAGGGSIAYGIYVSSQDHVKIANNTVTSVASGQTITLYGIYSGTATNGNADIYNNTVNIAGGGTNTSIYAIYNAAGGSGTNNTVKINNNTVTGSTYATATTGDMYLIEQGATAYNVEISGNTLTNNSFSATTSGSFYMIHQDGAVNESKIFNNTITGNTKTTGTTGAAYCIYNNSAATANNQVYNNIIDNIAVTNTSGSLTGIHVLTGATNAVYNNRISGLTNTASTTGAVYGITLGSGGVTNNVYNNMIVDLNAPTSTTTGTSTTDLVRGINITSTTANTTQNVSFNTVLLKASGGAFFSTSGVFHTTSTLATSSVLNLRNNIIVNQSTASGIGYVAAYRRSSANALLNYGSVSNNNLFYVIPAPNHVIFYDGTTSDADLTALKSRVSPRESASISENPNFVAGVAAPYDLHIDPAIPTQIESGATVIAGITTDIDGQVRSATTPDIGADEFTGMTADLTGPTIMYTPLPVKTICTDAKTITATITDPNNVNVAAGTKPRLWFKKATENDQLPATNTSASNGWKYVEPNDVVSPFVFTFDFSLLTSPLVPGDSISYFIVAQDLAPTPNVGVNIAAFNSTPATVALSASAFPLSGNINGFTVLTLPAVTVKTNNANVCISGTVKLDIDNVDVAGGEYQWQSSSHGTNTWTDMPGGITLPFVTPVLTDTTDFRLVVKCSGVAVPASPSNIVVVNVNNPQLVSTTGATRCGTGTLDLNATADMGSSINWYDSPIATTPLFTGVTFTTPAISTTTTYYAAASVEGGGLTSLGLPEVNSSPTSGAGTTNFGLVFDALSDFTLQSVTIYPIATAAGTVGTVTIDVIDGAGSVIHTATVNVVGYPSAAPVPQNVTLNFNITAGTNYKLRPGARSSGITGLLFNPSTSVTNYGYPFVLPGVVSINASTLGAAPGNTPRLDLYYYFYDWQIVSACAGTRVAVVATIDNCGLPVTLLSFKGEKQNTYNKLSWSTATEINNSGFELQRSVDGIGFSKMVFVNSKADNGNSTAILNYGFDDKLPLRGYNYYRLRQVDRDGKSTYSAVVAIRGEKPTAVQILAIYPNPVKNVLNLKLEAPQGQMATIIISDGLGKTIMQRQVHLITGEMRVQLATSSLAQGTYFVRVTCLNGCQSPVHKFIKE